MFPAPAARSWFDKLTTNGDKLTTNGDEFTTNGDEFTTSSNHPFILSLSKEAC